ncbi:MAG: zinc ABC transporter substrate-binding protein [Planctomycetota bacterium]
MIPLRRRRRQRRPAPLRLLLLLFLALLLPSCSGSPRAADAKPIVVATTGHIADVARTIGGDAVEVRQIFGPGVDPHTHQATRADVLDMYEADLVLVHGLHLEAQMRFTFDALRRGGRRLAVVTDAIPRERLIPADASIGGTYDPHVWMDPQLFSLVVDEIRDRLVALVPEARREMDERLETLHRELVEIDASTEAAVRTVPHDARVLVTAHDAFNYFARRYGIEVASIQGISTESEAGVRHVQELVDLIVERSVPAVFVETSVSTRGLEALLDASRRAGHDVRIGGSLLSDSLGPADTFEGTYLGMLDHNATTIVRALGGSAPERGHFGRLVAPPR